MRRIGAGWLEGVAMTAELEKMLSELTPKQAAFLRGLMEGKG